MLIIVDLSTSKVKNTDDFKSDSLVISVDTEVKNIEIFKQKFSQKSVYPNFKGVFSISSEGSPDIELACVLIKKSTENGKRCCALVIDFTARSSCLLSTG